MIGRLLIDECLSPELVQFAMANPKCDGRVNFRGMWGYVGIHRCARSRAPAFQSWVSGPKPVIKVRLNGCRKAATRVSGQPRYVAAVRTMYW